MYKIELDCDNQTFVIYCYEKIKHHDARCLLEQLRIDHKLSGSAYWQLLDEYDRQVEW